MVCGWNGWDAQRRANALLVALSGEAADYMNSQPCCKQMEYEEICSLLQK